MARSLKLVRGSSRWINHTTAFPVQQSTAITSPEVSEAEHTVEDPQATGVAVRDQPKERIVK